MIRVQCSNCNSLFDTDERYAGMTANCPNCQGKIVIPAPMSQSPNITATAPAQVNNIEQNANNMLTQKRSMGLAILLWFFLNGTQYFHLGQTGKGIIFTCLDVIFTFLDFFTCGIFAIFHGPWRLIWLIDTILVTSKLGKKPVSKWRFF